MTCGAKHPTMDLTCNRPNPPHGWHANADAGVSWDADIPTAPKIANLPAQCESRYHEARCEKPLGHLDVHANADARRVWCEGDAPPMLGLAAQLGVGPAYPERMAGSAKALLADGEARRATYARQCAGETVGCGDTFCVQPLAHVVRPESDVLPGWTYSAALCRWERDSGRLTVEPHESAELAWRCRVDLYPPCIFHGTLRAAMGETEAESKARAALTDRDDRHDCYHCGARVGSYVKGGVMGATSHWSHCRSLREKDGATALDCPACAGIRGCWHDKRCAQRHAPVARDGTAWPARTEKPQAPTRWTMPTDSPDREMGGSAWALFFGSGLPIPDGDLRTIPAPGSLPTRSFDRHHSDVKCSRCSQFACMHERSP